MSEWFGWLQQKALADPFAKRYAQVAQGVLLVLAALVFVLFFAFIVVYNPSTAEPSPRSTDRTWADNLVVVQMAVGLFVLGVVTLLAGLLRSIKTSIPQPDWRSFPSLWSLRQKQGMALLSGVSTFLGLGVASTVLILIVAASGPQWLVGAVSVVLVSITMWGR